MKIIIAPQTFKATLPALAAAQAIARGIAAADPTAQTILAPIADGGDGTLNALVQATGGQTLTTTVTGPLGQPVNAQWGIMGDRQTAVIEMALASGLALIPQRQRNPRTATTAGTGQLLKEALDRGYRNIIIGLGGSATNDGGAGLATALGAQLLDPAGQPLPPGGAALANLHTIQTGQLHPALPTATITAATDVTNPLCGPNGASHIFGPQKGADPETIQELDAALHHYAQIISRDLHRHIAHHPGAGAAGGLGAGLLAFTNATLQSGIDLICQVLNFDAHLQNADLVITGEGRADRSTTFNKAPVGIARRAHTQGVPTILLAGSLGPGYQELYHHHLSAIISIADRPMTFDQSLARTPELLETAAERTLRLIQTGRQIAQRPNP